MRSPSFWYPPARPTLRDQLLRLAMTPFAALYSAGAGMRHRMTVPERISVPVICIGNFTAGGAGKTPTAIAIAKRLETMGETPHFVSRGYGGQEAGPVCVDPERHSSADVGDEPLLLSKHSTTWVSQDRVAGALAAERAGASVIVLDDGFQNPALHKDLSLLVVDTGAGIGNGSVIPAGPLREPMEAAFKRTHGIVALGAEPLSKDLVQRAKQAAVPICCATLQPSIDVGPNLTGTKFIAFAGIGRPEKFFSTLRELGVILAQTRSFPDHHSFSNKEAQDLLDLANREEASLITTEKDAARLRRADSAAGKKLREQTEVLPVTALFSDLPGLDALLIQHLTAARASHTYAPPGTRRD
ncbi:MAG: tetraacyldisaccharide 4'-kinase [Parvibaculaceae bacterium]|mgnify:CR=1 FL=1|nr:tetraacyldisaccharide 4'-kinase [Parvibaculaceae bacterium]